MLCFQCEKIGAAAHAVIEEPLTSTIILHSPSLQALRDSAEAGCDSCVLLIETSNKQIGIDRVSNLPNGKDTLSYEVTFGFNPSQSVADHVIFYFGHTNDFMPMVPYVEQFVMELVEEPQQSEYLR